MKWHIETIEIQKIKEFEKNPRDINEKGLKDLTKSVNKFGLAEPLVLNTDFTLIGGHARLIVLKQNNEKTAECYLPDRKLADKEVEELNIRLNKNQAGTFNLDILANEFEINDLQDWGFEELEFG